MKKKFLILIAVLAPFGFTACGGGGGSSSTTDGTTTTTSESVVFGKIDAFGSVIIGNRKLSTDDNTMVVIGDDERPWDDSTHGGLRVGHIATVDDSDGHADVVRVDESVKGPVDATAPDLVVMGQVVVEGLGTFVDDNCPASFSEGDLLEVYGEIDDQDQIQAIIIECKGNTSNTADINDLNRYSLIGVVDSHIPGDKIVINGLTVDISGDIGDDMPGGDWAGLLVQVKDDAKAYQPGSASMVATKVEPQASLSDLASSTTQKVEIESYVTAEDAGTSSFQMVDLTVTHDGSTTFLYGRSADIAVGVRLEAEGFYNSDTNTLEAVKIKFDDNDIRVQGVVNIVDTSTLTFLDGAITVIVPDTGVYKDTSFGALEDDTSVIEVQGFKDLNNPATIIANEIEFEAKDANDEKKSYLRGPVSKVDRTNSTVTILDVEVKFDASTEFHDESTESSETIEDNIGADAFFALVTENATTIKARWDDFSSITEPAKEMEIEEFDD